MNMIRTDQNPFIREKIERNKITIAGITTIAFLARNSSTDFGVAAAPRFPLSQNVWPMDKEFIL
jgi:hypothetical protein